MGVGLKLSDLRVIELKPTIEMGGYLLDDVFYELEVELSEGVDFLVDLIVDLLSLP